MSIWILTLGSGFHSHCWSPADRPVRVQSFSVFLWWAARTSESIWTRGVWGLVARHTVWTSRSKDRDQVGNTAVCCNHKWHISRISILYIKKQNKKNRYKAAAAKIHFSFFRVACWSESVIQPFLFLLLHSLQASNCVMDLDHVDGKLKIHYSDRLSSLLREERQLAALGFTIPAVIQKAAKTADKFYRQAIVLKQVRIAMELINSFIVSFIHLSFVMLCRWPIFTIPLTSRWFPLKGPWCWGRPWPLNKSLRY